MQVLRFLLIGLVAGSTLLAAGATFAKLGVPDINHPQGINLKKESLRHGPHGMYYRGRSHYGGGMRGHK